MPRDRWREHSRTLHSEFEILIFEIPWAEAEYARAAQPILRRPTQNIFPLLGRDSLLPVTPKTEASMKLVSPLKKEVAGGNPATETILLSAQQLDYVARMSSDIDPAMHR